MIGDGDRPRPHALRLGRLHVGVGVVVAMRAVDRGVAPLGMEILDLDVARKALLGVDRLDRRFRRLRCLHGAAQPCGGGCQQPARITVPSTHGVLPWKLVNTHTQAKQSAMMFFSQPTAYSASNLRNVVIAGVSITEMPPASCA